MYVNSFEISVARTVVKKEVEKNKDLTVEI